MYKVPLADLPEEFLTRVAHSVHAAMPYKLKEAGLPTDDGTARKHAEKTIVPVLDQLSTSMPVVTAWLVDRAMKRGLWMLTPIDWSKITLTSSGPTVTPKAQAKPAPRRMTRPSQSPAPITETRSPSSQPAPQVNVNIDMGRLESVLRDVASRPIQAVLKPADGSRTITVTDPSSGVRRQVRIESNESW